MNENALLDFTLFNPGAVSKEVLLEEFTARHDMLDDILKIISENKCGAPQQHVLLIGPRGMGKTFTLMAIAYNVEDHPKLSKEWLPIIFSEENYCIGDLADFWLESLRRLQEKLYILEDRAQTLLEENPPGLAEHAKEAFLSLLSNHGGRAILLLDNINEIFHAINDEAELHSLRAFLMEDHRVMVIGSAPTYFSEVLDVEKPFYDFFREFVLERFQKEEMEEALHRIAEFRNDENVKETLEKEPERIHSLRILTGGNPRLVKMVYRLLLEGAGGDVRGDLQRLLDDCTPYFKHRIEGLKTQARRVFDAVARGWDPVTVGELSVSLRKPSNYISSQIKRLVEEGFLEEAGGTEKKKTYQVAERFYNIYYLMRFSRTGRHRLEWLVGFMKIFYKPDDYRKWTDKTVEELRGIQDRSLREERLSFLSSMTVAAEGPELRKELLHKTIRAVIDSDGIKALSNIIDVNLAKKELGPHFSILEFLSRLSEERQKALKYQPEDAAWWYSIYNVLSEKNHYLLAEQAINKAIEIGPETAYFRNSLGYLLQDHLERYEDAEAAYRKAIELDTQDATPWNNLGYLLQDHLGHYEEAEAAYRKAIELAPQFSYPWYNLGNLLQEHLKRYEEAEAAYRKAIELGPQNAIPWNNLGNLLQYHLKRYEEAEAAYRKAIDLDPQDADPYSGLADLLIKTGRAGDALEPAIHGVCYDPDYEFARYIFLEVCRGSLDPWLKVLPETMNYLKENPENDEVYRFALNGLIQLARDNRDGTVLELVEAAGMREKFGPLLLAIQARKDRKILSTLAPERRALVIEVMDKITS